MSTHCNLHVQRPDIEHDEHASDYATYLWQHIPLFTWWATEMTTINSETIRFRRIDDISAYHFFTPTDLLIGAHRAAHLLQENPHAFSVSLLTRTRIPHVLSGDWKYAPTDRNFVSLALQLSVFESVTFPLRQHAQDSLLTA